ncbi:hypothetical protein Tco_1070281 [Tanacetum coccineum]|uniref:Reverse transcriptase domain-containing protein n=1 Tax=Tanacetum coccineum TaxID=301880 RepID=A0ABQ5HM32_9ASTR
MRTRSSSNLVGESSPNPTTSNPRRRNRRRSKQPFSLEESPVDTMADQRTMAELLRAPTEGYAEAIVVPPILAEHFELKHSLINMMTSDQFFGLEKDNPHDHIPTPPPASVKAVEEICVTCGGAHPYYQCLAADGNTFRDNIQGYVSAAAVNYNQGNFGYRPPSVANQIRPPGFAQPNVQNNQNRFSQPQGYNRGNNFNQDTSYQAPIQQNQVVPLSELEKIKKINEVNIKAMQAQINNVKNELRNEMQTSIQASMSNQTNELKNMMASFFQMNIASTSGSGSLPSNTVANPRGELIAITTRSGLVLDGPSVPMPPLFINPEEHERVEETLTDPELAEYIIKIPCPLVQKAKPISLKNYVLHQRDPLYLNIPYPSRMHQEKQQEKDDVQIHKFWQMFKQLYINISLANALILIPKYQKILKSLLSNKEILLELANTLLNENCSAVILKKLPEKLGDPGKFLIPYSFSELKYKALADLGNDNHVDLLLEDFADELTLITFPPGNDDLPFDIESDLREIEYSLNNDPTKEMDSILEDSVDEGNLADDLVNTIPEMFTNEHTLDYSSPPLYDDVDDDLVELESNNDNVYDDAFDSKEDKIKESKLLIDELDPPRSSDFLPSPKCDSVFYEDFSEVDALPSTNNEDKVFNPGILIHENLFEVPIRVTNCAKNVKKTTNASLILEDFNPPLYELPFYKEVPGSETQLSFSSENEEKVFNPGILTSKGVHTSLLLELSHRGPKALKVIKIFESPMEIFPCSYGEDIHVLDVPCLHFYPP